MQFKYRVYVAVFTVLVMLIISGTFLLIAPSVGFKENKEIVSDIKKEKNNIKVKEKKSNVDNNIKKIVRGYLSAKQKVDIDVISAYVDDIGRVDEKRLVTEAEYIEEYKNIQCTIKKIENNAYRVYVYYDVKIYDIDTLIPSLIAVYVKADKSGDYKICLGNFNSDTERKIRELDESAEIKSMELSVQEKLQNIVSTDTEVRRFYEKLGAKRDSQE